MIERAAITVRLVVVAGMLSLLAIVSVVVLRNAPTTSVIGDQGTDPWLITLDNLGYGHLNVPVQHEINKSEPISIPLPEGSTQGPNDWWLLYGHFTVEFAPDSGPGIIWISGATNDRIAIQLKIVAPQYSNGFMSHQVELLNGSSRQFTLSPTQTYGIANFLQLNGVKPGSNELVFQLRQTGDVQIRKLVIHDDTAMIRIPLGPPKLKLDAIFPREELIVGSQFPFDLQLASNGWPVKSLAIEIRDPEEAFQIEDVSQRTIKRLFGTHLLSYKVTPLKPGAHHLVFLTSTGNAGNPQARFETTVYRPNEVPNRFWLNPWQWGIVAGTLIISGVFLLWKYRATLNISGLRPRVSGRSAPTPAREGMIAIFVLATAAVYSFGLQALNESTFATESHDLVWYALGGGFLIISFSAGLLFVSTWWALIPILGYVSGMFLWYLVTGTSRSDISYDLPWYGFLLLPVGVPTLLMYLTFQLGRAFK